MMKTKIHFVKANKKFQMPVNDTKENDLQQSE